MKHKFLISFVFAAVIAANGLSTFKASFNHAHQESIVCHDHHCHDVNCEHTHHIHEAAGKAAVKAVHNNIKTANNVAALPCPNNSSHTLRHVIDQKEPTCTEQGYFVEYDYCDICKERFNSSKVEFKKPLGHLYGEWIIDGYPTCNEKGAKHKICSRCQKRIDEVIPPTNQHIYGPWILQTPSTCMSEGEEYRICQDCGHKEYRSIPMDPHLFGEWTIEREPTCSVTGLKARYCSFCGARDEEIIPITNNHNFSEREISKNPTCTSEGEEKRYCLDCGHIEYRSIPANNIHEYGPWEISIYPTCTSPGQEFRKCIHCGNSEKREVPKVEHEYGEWIIETQPNCTTTGLRYKECINCGNRITEQIPTNDAHNFTSWNISQAPTCTSPGYKTRTCIYCRKVETREIPMLDHNFGDWIISSSPTCSREGYRYRICQTCGHKEGESIPTIPHNFGDWIVVNEPTCISQGYKYRVCIDCGLSEEAYIEPTGIHTPGEPQEEYFDATCQNEGYKIIRTYCTVCGQLINEERVVLEPKKDHVVRTIFEDYQKDPLTGEESCLERDVCINCGEVISERRIAIPDHEHIYESYNENIVEATCGKPGSYDRITKCKICGDIQSIEHIVTEPIYHVPGPEIIENHVEPTCNSDGSEDYVTYCENCGAELSRRTITIPSDNNHIIDSGNIEKEIPATCQKEGVIVTVYRCQLCNKILKKDIQYTPKLEHSYGETIIENKVEPTCNKQGGYDEVRYCSVCHEKSVNHVTLEPTGEHNFSPWEIHIAPTCSSFGIEMRKCSICGQVETRQIPKLEHEPGTPYKRNISTGSCDEEGSYELVTPCKHCGEILSTEIITTPAESHEFGDWIITQTPTCERSGEKIRTCAKCGKFETQIIEPLGHMPGKPVVEKIEPTCLEDGKIITSIYCEKCGALIEQKEEVIKTTNEHVPGNTYKIDEVYPTCTTEGSYTEVVYCKYCGEEISRTVVKVPALGHKNSEWRVTKEPTIYEEGIESRYCTICGETETRAIPKLDATAAFISAVNELSKFDNADVTFDKLKTAYQLYELIEDKEKISEIYKVLEDFSDDFFDETEEFNEHHKASNDLLTAAISLNITMPLLAVLLLKLKRRF